MAYSKEKIEIMCNQVILDIESGLSLRKALEKENSPSNDLFYKWVDSCKENAERYACAREKRHDALFEQIIEIAYTPEIGTTTKETERGVEITTSDMVAHRRLKIDALKWCLAKMNPTKYGDRIQNEHSGEVTTTIISLGSGIKPTE